MFLKAAIDISEKNSLPDKRFISCIRFVADQVNPAVFYVSTDWSRLDLLRAIGLEVENLTPVQENILREHDLLPSSQYSQDAPALVYLIEGSWDKSNGSGDRSLSGLVVPTREFVLSSSALIHRAHLRDSGLNAQTAILCLAAVGLDIMLPNVAFNLLADEEIERIKEDLSEERHQYLGAVSDLAQQAYERLKDGDFKDVMRWAQSEVAFKLVPKARMIEESTVSMSMRQLQRAGFSFWKDGVPAIGSAYFSGGILPAAAAASEAVLRTLVASISVSRSERALPEIAYAMKIRKTLRDNE